MVSVVTPVYNGERYLRECIESVLAQTLDDFEYVILDNASQDATAEIAKAYAQRDPRIRHFRNEHTLPLLENWNTSMRLIHPMSQYCKVVHADDVLLPECLSRMVSVASANPSVVIVGAYRIDGVTVNMTSIPYPQEVVSGQELCRRRLLGQCPDLFGSPTSIMYRADVVRERSDFYGLDNPHADTAVCFDLLRHGDYGFVHQVLTVTRRHEADETTARRRTGTHSIGRLMIAQKYGPYFLTPAQQPFAVDLQLRHHYNFMGANVLRFRDRGFRRYQIDSLKACGVPLCIRRLAGATIVSGLRSLLRTMRRRFPG
jgi:glycosyltransferase involved in cell wall biosynthesis